MNNSKNKDEKAPHENYLVILFILVDCGVHYFSAVHWTSVIFVCGVYYFSVNCALVIYDCGVYYFAVVY